MIGVLALIAAFDLGLWAAIIMGGRGFIHWIKTH
jgi:hypothetical protein